MATVTGYTKAKMDAIANAVVVSGSVVGDDLILERYDTSTFNAGSVRGPQGIQGPEGPQGTLPAGTFIFGGWNTNPPGALILDGSTIVGGVATYPDLAACFPGWVSGGNLILPNAQGAVPLVNNSTFGSVQGSMTRQIGVEQLPSHLHSATHGHTAGSGTQSVSHTHPGDDHAHQVGGVNGGQGYAYRSVTGNTGYDILSSGPNVTLSWVLNPQTTNSGSGANTGVQSTSHTHSITVQNYTDNTGYTGSGLPIDHTPKNITVRMAVVY